MEKYIGNKRLADINQADMLELLDIVKKKPHKRTGEPISERTVRNHMNILKSIFRTAVELDMIRKSPMDNIKYSVSDYQLEDNYYDIDDINKMIFSPDDEPIVYQLAILLTLSTGLRIGELTALNEDDFNRNEHSIKISKAVSEANGVRKISTTKNKKIRVEFYPKELDLLIDKHLEIDKLKKKSLGVDKNLIFTGKNCELIPKDTISNRIRMF